MDGNTELEIFEKYLEKDYRIWNIQFINYDNEGYYLLINLPQENI